MLLFFYVFCYCTSYGLINHNIAYYQLKESPVHNDGGGKCIASAGYAKLKEDRPTWTETFFPIDSM